MSLVDTIIFSAPNLSAYLSSRVTKLENNETIFQIFEYVGTSTSGTLSVPTEATVFDIYGDGIIDAIVVEADGNQNPTENNSLNSSGEIVQVSSLTNAGAYTLDSSPLLSSCIIYFIKIFDKFKDNVSLEQILPPSIPLDQLNKLVWVYPYEAGEYPANTMTRVGDWTSISNKPTSDYPVPQYTGEEFNVYNGTISDNQVNARQLIFGTRYSSGISAYVKGYRVDVVAGNAYRLYSVADPLGSKIIKLELDFVAADTGWLDISIAPSLVLAGQTFDIVAVVNEPDPTPSVFVGNWNYQKPTNLTPPLSGQMTHSSKESNKLLIHYIDNDLGDRTVQLQTLEVGDLIRSNDVQWAIQSIIDQTTYIEFDVAPATQSSVLGVNSFEFETKLETPITYAVDVDYYLTDPNVSGLFIEDGSYDDIVVDDNAYGVDLLVQEVIQSDDWDVVASSANLGGGGNKKATDFLSQVEVTTEGDDKGVIFKYQVSAQGEIIAGKDSYPVPIAFHCQESDTVGKTITNAIDVTTILQSDTGSFTGLFGGVTAGSYLLVGSLEVYEGAKVKYNSLATVESANIMAEFYNNDTDGWLPVDFMGTNSDYPHEAHAWNIAVDNHDAEQVFFGFNPLTRAEPDTWDTKIFNINGVDYEYKFARFRVVSDITGDPQVEQLKLHTDRIENEATGIFKYGRARTPIDLPHVIIKNNLSDPPNEVVSYTPQYAADYVDNELANGQIDGFGVIINRVFNLDTSVPIVVGLSFYVKGIATGDIELNYEASQVVDGYVYDGLEPYDSYSLIKTIDVAQNLTRFSVSLPVRVNRLQENAGLVVNIFRDATAGNPEDTLAASIIRTNVNVTGFSWKL